MIVQVQAGCFTAFGIPTKYQPPLDVHPNAAITFQVATQSFKMIARRNTQILFFISIVDQLQLAKECLFQFCRNLAMVEILQEKLSQPVIPEI